MPPGGGVLRKFCKVLVLQLVSIVLTHDHPLRLDTVSTSQLLPWRQVCLSSRKKARCCMHTVSVNVVLTPCLPPDVYVCPQVPGPASEASSGYN